MASADKMRRTFPISISFVDGEEPSSTKLTGMASQSRNGIYILEQAMGDIWAQGGHATLNDGNTRRTLNIPSVGRTLGVNNAMNPDFFSPQNNFYLYENLTGDTNVLDFSFDPSATPTLDDGTTGNRQASAYAVDTDGDWYFNATTGKVHTYSSLAATASAEGSTELKGVVNTTDFPFHGGLNLSGNVIPPDEQDTNFTGCKVVSKGVSGYYYIFLPPRERLSDRASANTKYLHSTSNVNESSDATAEVKYYWGDATTAPTPGDTYDDHYIYTLPTIISGLTWGDRIPDGFIRLILNGQVLDGISIFKPSAVAYQLGYCLEIYAPNHTTELDAIATASGSYLVAHYQTGLKVITTGTSHSEYLRQIATSLFSHNHTNSTDGFSSRVNHQDLIYLDPDPNITPTTALPFKSKEVSLTASSWQNDGHLQYFHRGGSYDPATDADHRDIYNNAFLGDMLIGSTTKGSKPYYNNLSDDSHKLYFGSVSSSAPYIYFEQNPKTLHISNTDTGGDIALTSNSIISFTSAAGAINCSSSNFDLTGNDCTFTLGDDFIINATDLIDLNGASLDVDVSGNIDLTSSGGNITLSASSGVIQTHTRTETIIISGMHAVLYGSSDVYIDSGFSKLTSSGSVAYIVVPLPYSGTITTCKFNTANTSTVTFELRKIHHSSGVSGNWGSTTSQSTAVDDYSFTSINETIDPDYIYFVSITQDDVAGVNIYSIEVTYTTTEFHNNKVI